VGLAEGDGVGVVAVLEALAVEARGAADRSVVIRGVSMVPEDKINELVTRLRAAAGSNLLCVILYGSAAAGDYVDNESDLNLLCVMVDASFAALAKLAPEVEWWVKEENRAPLVMAAEELRRAADVFSIELLDMRQSYRVLWGDDALKTLAIPTRNHRAQLEYELREKTILLRQGMLMSSGKEEVLWDLLLRSAPTFATLFRHALLELGDPPASSKREAVEKVAKKFSIDGSAFLEVLDIREHKKEKSAANLRGLFSRYLKLLDQVTNGVDRVLDTPAL
jgi:predicted nucleotidyltransferase